MKKQVIAAVIAFVLGSCLVTLDAQGSFWTLINGRLQTRNPVGFATGSASAPSITFANDPDTGLYSSANNQITVAVNGIGVGTFHSGGFAFAADANALRFGASGDLTLSRVAAGEFGWTAVLFANLGTPANGTFAYCSDCAIANPCTGSGTGALAKRLNGVWVCN